MRVRNLLTNIRDTLADPRKERWSDERLLRLVDEAQKAIARRFELLHGEADIPMEPNTAIYTLPDDCWLITRCEYDSIVLDMYSYSEMDKENPGWQTETGNSLEAIVFNLRNIQEIRVYPLPDDEFEIEYYNVDPLYGVLTSFENVSTAEYGVVSNISVTPGEVLRFTSPFGIVADAYNMATLKVRYIRDPKQLRTLNDELELPAMFDTAIKFYVIGHSFMDDLDTEYQEKGKTSLRLYDAEAELLGRRTSTRNATRADNHRSRYRGFT